MDIIEVCNIERKDRKCIGKRANYPLVEDDAPQWGEADAAGDVYQGIPSAERETE